MRPILCLAVFLVLLGNTPPKWQLVWTDDFDREDIFTTNIWSKIPRNSKIDWCNTMSDEEHLYEIENGNLILVGKMNTELVKDSSAYITGGVFTKGKKYFESGKIEVRCKLEGTQGSWPAIWMLPRSAQWPTGGEIDILERLNNDDFVYQTVHSLYTQKNKEQKHSSTHKIKVDEYNVYGVEWDSKAIRFYVNNELSYTYKCKPKKVAEGQYPFINEPFYLLIDMQLGGNWVGEVKPFEKPIKMYIDWVRYYKKT